MPPLDDPIPRIPLLLRLLFWLTDPPLPLVALGSIVIIFLFPLTVVNVCASSLLYLYLRYEHLLNSSLVRRTPQSSDDRLPSRGEWLANGGLKKLLPPELDDLSDDERCSICYHLPNDPSQIILCGHIFCAECVGAWHALGRRSCPQCTIVLWRKAPNNGSRLERLVKITAAVGVVAFPLNVLALCTCFAHYIFYATDQIGIFRVLLLLGFVLSSAYFLTVVATGLQFMVQQRRTEGIGWWGDGIDPGLEQAWRMTMTTGSKVFGGWLLLMSVTFEAFIRSFVPSLDLRILGRK